MHNTFIRRTGLALGVAILATSLSNSPASATAGLFGSQDATYDGVYRQSLVIAGLRAHHVAVPDSALSWLRSQQCADGGFEGFRTDPGKACSPGNPDTYSGEDTNATAAAVLAFRAVGDGTHARRALAFLRAAQNEDGGFPYYKGGASDVNSTAMVMLALTASGTNSGRVRNSGHSPLDFLSSAMLGCDAAVADRGALAYMPGTPNDASDMAAVQAAAALAARTPWTARVTMTLAAAELRAVSCPGGTPTTQSALREAVSGYLGRRLLSNGNTIPNGWAPGADLTSTAWAVIGLAGADRAGGPASLADRALRAAAKSYVFDGEGRANAGRVGLLLLLTAARQESAKSFGGVHLVKVALASLGTN